MKNDFTKRLNLSKNGFYLWGFLFHPFITINGFKVSSYLDEMGREGQGTEVFRNARLHLLTRLTLEASFPRTCLEKERQLQKAIQETLRDFRPRALVLQHTRSQVRVA